MENTRDNLLERVRNRMVGFNYRIEPSVIDHLKKYKDKTPSEIHREALIEWFDKNPFVNCSLRLSEDGEYLIREIYCFWLRDPKKWPDRAKRKKPSEKKRLEVTYSLTEDRRWIIHKLTIRDEKPIDYIKEILEN